MREAGLITPLGSQGGHRRYSRFSRGFAAAALAGCPGAQSRDVPSPRLVQGRGGDGAVRRLPVRERCELPHGSGAVPGDRGPDLRRLVHDERPLGDHGFTDLRPGKDEQVRSLGGLEDHAAAGRRR